MEAMQTLASRREESTYIKMSILSGLEADSEHFVINSGSRRQAEEI